nr:MAG: DNA pilot protein [Microvirus sp.]
MSFFGSVVNLASTAMTNAANKKAASKAFDRDINMMNRVNEYNLPVNQMQRFKDAGLNPNLIYGSVHNSSAPAPPARQSVYSAPELGDPLESTLNFWYDLKQKHVMTDNVRANTDATRQRMESEILNQNLQSLNIAGKRVENARSSFDLQMSRNLEKNMYEVAALNAETVKLNNRRAIQEMKLNDSRLHQMTLDAQRSRYELDDLQKGIRPHDAPWMRVGSRLLDSLGGNLSDGVGTFNQFTDWLYWQKRRFGEDWRSFKRDIKGFFKR